MTFLVTEQVMLRSLFHISFPHRQKEGCIPQAFRTAEIVIWASIKLLPLTVKRLGYFQNSKNTPMNQTAENNNHNKKIIKGYHIWFCKIYFLSHLFIVALPSPSSPTLPPVLLIFCFWLYQRKLRTDKFPQKISLVVSWNNTQAVIRNNEDRGATFS